MQLAKPIRWIFITHSVPVRSQLHDFLLIPALMWDDPWASSNPNFNTFLYNWAGVQSNARCSFASGIWSKSFTKGIDQCFRLLKRPNWKFMTQWLVAGPNFIGCKNFSCGFLNAGCNLLKKSESVKNQNRKKRRLDFFKSSIFFMILGPAEK